jgi:hypothetical protein
LLGDFSFLQGLQPVSAEETILSPDMVRLGSEIEPVVRLLENTPRERLLEEFGARVKSGKLTYRQILAALQLAGVRNVQPRPVGFKFHSVLVVNSAHLASMASPDSDRWLPIFWALDYYKKAEAEDVSQNNWTMASVKEAEVPVAHRARKAFIQAMESWNVPAADAAIAGLVRTASVGEIFELFARFGSRDYRDIGHKAIFVANSFRTLQNIGWQHAEPILRSLTYALLAHESTNPSGRDSELDRPWRENQNLEKEIPLDWQNGKRNDGAVAELLEMFRQASPGEACENVVKHLQSGVAPSSVWDAGFQFASELLMRNPGIIALHAVTSANAMHYAYQACSKDRTRRLLILQFAAFLTLFRQDPKSLKEKKERIHLLEPGELPTSSSEALESIFAEVTTNRYESARKILAFCQRDADHAQQFVDNARRMLFLKGDNAHDYKFTSAVLEDFYQISPGLRESFLAASVYNLRGANERDNPLVQRTRAALG